VTSVPHYPEPDCNTTATVITEQPQRVCLCQSANQLGYTSLRLADGKSQEPTPRLQSSRPQLQLLHNSQPCNHPYPKHARSDQIKVRSDQGELILSAGQLEAGTCS
jgi:hypothetical protein